MQRINQLLLLSALFVSCLSSVSFAQKNFSSIDAFKTTLKNNERLSVEAKGDLNGDGSEDWVGVIHDQPADESPTYQLFVLLREPAGGYRIAEKTQKAEIPGMGCCWLEDLVIRNGSVYIQNNAKTAATMEAATHQFKFYKGDWRLVGLRIYLTDHTPGAEMTHDTETNVLTGLIIEKTQKGDNRPVSRRRNKKFPISLLRDFDFSNGFGTE